MAARGRPTGRRAGEGATTPATAPRKAVGGKRAEIAANAAKGVLPPVPDFTAETHKRFRGKLDQVVKMVEDKDVAGLKAFQINPISSSPKAIARYRDLAVIALEAPATA